MKRIKEVIFKSLFVNTVLAIIKIAFGYVASSKALIADGIHSLSDTCTDIFVLISSKIANKKADKEHPYGHGKVEYLSCLVIGIVVVSLGITLIKESLNSEITTPSNIALYVSIFTIVSKYLLASYILKKGAKYKSDILIASGKESRADVLSSVVVLISILLSKLSYINPIFNYSDIIATIVVGGVIISVGVRILAENIEKIIGKQETEPEILNLVKEKIKMNTKIKDFDKLILLKVGSYYRCELNIYLNKSLTIKESSEVIKDLKKSLINKETRIKYVNTNIKPFERDE